MKPIFNDLDYKVLDLSEIRTVINDLNERRMHPTSKLRAENAWVNMMIFRLSCCCGLRSKEIRHLRLTDLMLEGSRPAIRIRSDGTKGHKSRLVPLWWDQQTLTDIKHWVAHRLAHYPVTAQVISSPRQKGLIMRRNKVAYRWSNAIKALPPIRVKQLTVHCGRHSFISHALHHGRSLVEVQRAAGHSTILITQAYMHVVDSGRPTNIFSMEDSNGEKESYQEEGSKGRETAGAH